MLITGSRAEQIYRNCRMLDDERKRRLVEQAKQHREAAEAAEFHRRYGNARGFLRPAFSMGENDFFHFVQTHSLEEVCSKEFRRFHQKHHPEMAASKI